MTQRLALNLVLLGVVAGLVLLAVNPRPQTPAPGLRVTALERDAVYEIGVRTSRHPPVLLTREADAWRMEAPLQAPADSFRVQALLAMAQARSAEGFSAGDSDLEQYGLDPPLATVRFDHTTLLLGDTDPVAGRRYVLAGGRVYLVEDRWFSHVFGQPEAWVDPRPLMGAQQPTAIHLPTVRWQLEDGRWRRTPPAPSISADAGPMLAAAWRLARAISVAAYDDRAPWSGTVTVEVAEQLEPLHFRFARLEDAWLLARIDLGVQYRLLPRQGTALLGSAPR